jgi:class 3 adenylate cyclase
MPIWNIEYYESLVDRFSSITDGLDDRLEAIIDGRIAPAVEDIPIGSARHLNAAVLFFDIRGFTSRTSSNDLESLKKALQMLDCLIPMIQRVVFDHGGYVEKNTGDGVMAIIGAESDEQSAANNALNVATISFYVIKNLVNEYLDSVGIDPVEARIGIDHGRLLLARIGTPKGSASQARSFLTVVGPAANIAHRLQTEVADDNEILVGDQIKVNAAEYRQGFFKDRTPADWSWIYERSLQPYRAWHYDAYRIDPA